jgi:hypothetical protein
MQFSSHFDPGVIDPRLLSVIPSGSIGSTRNVGTDRSSFRKEVVMSEPSVTPAYKRVLLKLSGNSFCRAGESGITMAEVSNVSEQIKRIHDSGVQLAIVCGGGNILRGRDFAAVSAAIKAPTAHYMGMLATVVNGLALQDALENAGVPTRLQTAIRMEGVAEPFIRRRCVRSWTLRQFITAWSRTFRSSSSTTRSRAIWNASSPARRSEHESAALRNSPQDSD